MRRRLSLGGEVDQANRVVMHGGSSGQKKEKWVWPRERGLLVTPFVARVVGGVNGAKRRLVEAKTWPKGV